MTSIPFEDAHAFYFECRLFILSSFPSSGIQVLARRGTVLAITEDDNKEFDASCDAVIRFPPVEDWVSPLVTVVPLQLLSYYIADLRKCDVDKPRNLAKSVTVE
jgi:glucosamine--fructose-6-phosphate aminotransferase (isomerizing)